MSLNFVTCRSCAGKIIKKFNYYYFFGLLGDEMRQFENLDLTNDDINFEEIDDLMSKFQQDPMMKVFIGAFVGYYYCYGC